MSAQSITRTAFVTSRRLEFLSEKELVAQCGHPVAEWPLVVIKELADNALDECEAQGIAPEITITVDTDESWIEVADNGPGIPVEIVDRLPDFSVRVSSREAYVAPDRGAQGNALRTILAMPFVLHGEQGRVDITGGGQHTSITIGIDRIEQKPAVLGWERLQKTGSCVRAWWPRELARELAAIRRFAFDLAALNPHLTLAVTTESETQRFEASDPDWRKWRPSSPTSPHWYTLENFERLIGAYVVHDNEHRNGQPERTVRGFISEFAGLSNTAKQKQILEATGLSAAPLSALISNGDFDRAKTEHLLRVMRAQSKEIKPVALGTIGREHMRRRLAMWDTEGASFGYKAVHGFDDSGLPQIVEVAFAAFDEGGHDYGRRLIAGVNWSPALGNPFERDQLLADRYLGRDEPIVLAIHVANPRVAISDRGKARVQITGGQIEKALGAVGQSWTKQRKAEERSAAARARREQLYRSRRTSLKEIAYGFMERAYLQASDNGSLPTHWRMVFYVIRPLVDAQSDRPLTDTYFKQVIEGYLDDMQPGWDITRGARGVFKEPHGGLHLAMSTMNVREFLAAEQPASRLGHLEPRFPTFGPVNRYGAVLICEKEGFDELLEAERIPALYDLALMSTKGISALAARDLARMLAIPCFTLHDFDKNGFVQAAPFRSMAVDLGIRLDDIDEWGLQTEEQKHENAWQAKRNLLSNGATEDEADFIANGERAELNMFTSRDFIKFVTGKLDEHGVKKVIPDDVTLAEAWKRAHHVRRVNGAIESLHSGPRITLKGFYADAPEMPSQLRTRIEDALAKDRTQTWDDVVWELAGDR
jgi:hypothetical protein